MMRSAVGFLRELDAAVDSRVLRQFIEGVWQKSIAEQLQAYVRIPNKSPAFDPDWERHVHMYQAVELMVAWCRSQPEPVIWRGLKIRSPAN
jgi:hypothetical protein